MTKTLIDRFHSIQDSVMAAADTDGDFCGKTDYRNPDQPRALWQVKLGGIWYDVDIQPSDDDI